MKQRINLEDESRRVLNLFHVKIYLKLMLYALGIVALIRYILLGF